MAHDDFRSTHEPWMMPPVVGGIKVLRREEPPAADTRHVMHKGGVWLPEGAEPPKNGVWQPPATEEPAVMPANPKQFYGDTKVPLHLFPSTAIAAGATAFLEGLLKYGRDNFRAAPVEAMTYVRAAMSHLLLYAEGEDTPSDSPNSHLSLALASIAILIDATYAGSLIDNRKFPGGYAKALAELQPLVAKLRKMHGDKNPKHYSIADGPQMKESTDAHL